MKRNVSGFFTPQETWSNSMATGNKRRRPLALPWPLALPVHRWGGSNAVRSSSAVLLLQSSSPAGDGASVDGGVGGDDAVSDDVRALLAASAKAREDVDRLSLVRPFLPPFVRNCLPFPVCLLIWQWAFLFHMAFSYRVID